MLSLMHAFQRCLCSVPALLWVHVRSSMHGPELCRKHTPPVYLERPFWKSVPWPWRSRPRHCPRYSQLRSPATKTPTLRSPATQLPS